MKTLPSLTVAFREVRHFQPDDCLHVEPIDVRGRLHHWTIPAHRHDGLHQFQLLERGAAQVSLDGTVHALQGPAALMVAPGAVHGFSYLPDSEGFQVTVPTVMLSDALAGAPVVEGRLAASMVLGGNLIAADVNEALDLFRQLAREFQLSRPGRAQALKSHVTLIALWFLRHAVGQSPEEHRLAQRDTLVQRFRALVELHHRRQRQVSFYAQALEVTPDHLSRACRAIDGQAALELVHGRLLLEARRLLAYTPATVQEIAHELGFDDPAYFSRFFTRETGQSPSAYRAGLADGVNALPDHPPGTPAQR